MKLEGAITASKVIRGHVKRYWAPMVPERHSYQVPMV